MLRLETEQDKKKGKIFAWVTRAASGKQQTANGTWHIYELLSLSNTILMLVVTENPFLES